MYSLETIEAASRVGKIFANGCDRCNLDDLILLEEAKLMTIRTCTKEDEWHMDSLEAGEPLYEFNEDGNKLVQSILSPEQK